MTPGILLCVFGPALAAAAFWWMLWPLAWRPRLASGGSRGATDSAGSRPAGKRSRTPNPNPSAVAERDRRLAGAGLALLAGMWLCFLLLIWAANFAK